MTHRDKGITKQGRRDLRYMLIEAAHTAVRTHPYWKRALSQMAKRIGEMEAIVELARKLLVVMWHVLVIRSADR